MKPIILLAKGPHILLTTPAIGAAQLLGQGPDKADDQRVFGVECTWEFTHFGSFLGA